MFNTKAQLSLYRDHESLDENLFIEIISGLKDANIIFEKKLELIKEFYFIDSDCTSYYGISVG